MWIEIRFYLYVLIDPRDLSWRYVGVTKEPKKRIRHHQNAQLKTPKSAWIQELKTLGLEPLFKVIQDFDYPESCYKAEYALIKELRPEGLLLNMTDGGKGGRSGMKMSYKNRSHLSLIKTGHIVSKEVRQKISFACLGNTKRKGSHHSEEAKNKMKLAWERRRCGVKTENNS